MTAYNSEYAAQRIISAVADRPDLASGVKEVSYGYADGAGEPVGPRGVLELNNGACVIAISDADNHDNVLVSMVPFRGQGAVDVARDFRRDVHVGDEVHFTAYVANEFAALAAHVNETYAA